MNPWQCPSKTTQALGSMQQHLFTLQMHTYKVQEGVMACGWSPRRARWQVRLVLHLEVPWSSQLLHSKTSVTQGEILWQGEAPAGESPLLLAYVAHEPEDVGEYTLLSPEQVPFLYVFFPQDVPLLCHLVLCWLVTPLGVPQWRWSLLYTSSGLSMGVSWLHALSVPSI
jgi:hypothetical protein